MMVSKTPTVLFLILVANLGGFLPLSWAQSSDFKFDMSEIHWNGLSFESKNFLGNVKTEARLEKKSIDEVKGRLIASPQGAVLEPSGTKVFRIRISSTIEPLIGSNEILTTWLWFTPQEAAAFQRIRLRKGKEKWEKTYRWTENGVCRLRRQPKGTKEEELSPEQWTDIETDFYPYDLPQNNCESVAGPSALLYVVSAAGLAVGNPPLDLCVFGKKQLHHVQIRAEKNQRLKINYLETSQHNETRRKGKAEVLKISVASRPLIADEVKTEPFSFLGIKGDFDIYIKKDSKLPVRISGQIPKVGRLDFQLQKVQLR